MPENSSPSSEKITTLITPLVLPTEAVEKKGRETVGLLGAPSTDLVRMHCEYGILAPGESASPPQVHDEEEILMLVAGEAEFIAEDAQGSNRLKRFKAKQGDLIYHPSNWRHTLENTSEKPAVYVLYNWLSDDLQTGEILESSFIKASESLQIVEEPTDKIKFTVLLKGKTHYLRTLQCHKATLQPGQGYIPHDHDYDISIIHLEGQVETLGQTVEAPAFIYYAAGQVQGMKNTGNSVATHIAFELHGKQGDAYESRKARRKRKLIQCITQPRILVDHLKWKIKYALKK